jgi:hypothetical protein
MDCPISSPCEAVLPTTGRGQRTPLPAAPAGRSSEERRGRLTMLWSTGLGLAAAYIGPDRFFTLRFAAAFCLAAVLQFGPARAAFEWFVPSPTEMHS